MRGVRGTEKTGSRSISHMVPQNWAEKPVLKSLPPCSLQMSAMGQKRTLIKRGKRCLLYTSKRTLLSVGLDVRFVPKADMSDWFLVAALGREGALIPIRGRIVAVLTIWRWIAAIRWRKSVDHQARGLGPEGRPFLVTESSPRARHGSVVLRLRQRIKVGLCISPTGKATNRGWRRQRSNCQCPML